MPSINMDIFKSPNMIIAFVNILFFIVVQTIFFKFVASKQFNVVLKDKVDILNSYLSYDPEAKVAVHAWKASPEYQVLEQTALIQERKREDLNVALMKSWIGVPFLLAIVILTIFLYMLLKSNSKDTWTGVDTAVLSLVVGAYATEILFYLTIVRQYEFYGDIQIYNKLYSDIHHSILST